MSAVLVVFGQRADAHIDIASWNAHAERFFSTRLGLTVERHYRPGDDPPRSDDVHFVVAPAGAPPGIRAASAGPREDADLALADEAELTAGGSGLALLARRCPIVWRIAVEGDADVLALRLAAILASILLGPILDPRLPEIFGVKTARAKLEPAAAR
ncbi:MAG TPA: hypothetical protein VH044_11130 [Polyangiaceae bacterium]|jgi:hypothetical protein|nr:hypothetical protein [Polyangiaceae bacterium]